MGSIGVQKQDQIRKGVKKVGVMKTHERSKPQPSNSRPMRGLIFGPTGKDVELSSNGKRLRIETEIGGRSPGCAALCVRVSGTDEDMERMQNSVNHQRQKEQSIEVTDRENVEMEAVKPSMV